MTKIFAVDDNNDLFIGETGNLAISLDLEAIREMSEHAVKVVVGEIILDIEAGVIGFDQNNVFGNSPNLISFEFRARAAMTAIDGVTKVSDFKARLVENVIVYSATIDTIFGTDPIGDSINGIP